MSNKLSPPMTESPWLLHRSVLRLRAMWTRCKKRSVRLYRSVVTVEPYARSRTHRSALAHDSRSDRNGFDPENFFTSSISRIGRESYNQWKKSRLFARTGCAAAKTTAKWNVVRVVQPSLVRGRKCFGEGICLSGRNVRGKLPRWEISRRKSPEKMTGSTCSVISLYVRQL